MKLRDELASLGISLPQDLRIDRWTETLGDAPAEYMLKLLGLSTVVFYAAEKNHNPKVCDIWDSLVYCSTCLSVGYSDIFAKTPAGKILGSTLMTIGPSLAANAIEGEERNRMDTTQQQMLETLKQILARLGNDPPRGEAERVA